jgi:hypothetical protein
MGSGGLFYVRALSFKALINQLGQTLSSSTAESGRGVVRRRVPPLLIGRPLIGHSRPSSLPLLLSHNIIRPFSLSLFSFIISFRLSLQLLHVH